MKNCIIVHGCPSDKEKDLDASTRTYDKYWIAWLKSELPARGIRTEVPLMPEPWEPDYGKFKGAFEKCEINEATVLVGHSCGCAFLVRWLGETKRRVDKLILVAPWNVPDKDTAARIAFYTHPIDPTIKSRVNKITIFTADNEWPDGKKSAKLCHEALGGRIIELKGHGHYIMRDMKTAEFPELLTEVMSD
jgi:predicted alpha/beta hydrolase family esterase